MSGTYRTFWRAALGLTALAALSLAVPMSVSAGERRAPCCAQCGREGHCCKVCRLECTEKGTPTTIWGIKCEEFCIPCPSVPKCDRSVSLHDDEAKDPPCSCPKKFAWTTWLVNRHAQMFTRKKLMKQIVHVKTPAYKWVVEDLCPDCRSACKPIAYPAGTKLPPQPHVDGAAIVAGTEE